MSRKKKKEPESVLQGAKMPVVEQVKPPEKKTSPVITVPLAILALLVVVFGLVRWIRFAWYF